MRRTNIGRINQFQPVHYGSGKLQFLVLPSLCPPLPSLLALLRPNMPSFLPSENALFLPFLKSFYALLKCPPFFPPKMPSFFLRKCPLFFPPKMPSVCPSLKTPLKLFVPILNWCPLCKTFWYHLYLRLPVWGLLKIHVLPLMCILSNLVGKFIVADMEVDMVAEMDVDKVANMQVDMVTDRP